MATYSNAMVRFHALDMLLRGYINASNITEPEARSRAAGHFFLGIIPSKFAWECLNIPIHVNCNILIFAAASATKELNVKMFCDRKIFYHHTEHIRRNR